MLFFGKRAPADPNAPKRRSVFGMLFNPQIGEAIRPLGETTSVFVQLIAMVFAMNGLFPKDHPGITGAPGAKLSLGEVLSTAWNDLSFTKAGLPKVVLFFAVVGMMVVAVLSIVTALLGAFIGSAHAQTIANAPNSGSYFSSAGTDDLAQNWLDYIFKGIPLSDYYSQTGATIPQSTGIQCAMISALGVYSYAMLIFAAFILFYHLVAMVVHTAHEGVVMGKRANQIWAPIRLVIAVGLLVPIGSGAGSCPSGTGAGLNSGQYIVIQMASWGSGLASQTWKTFINALSSMGNDYIRPNPPLVMDAAKDITLMEACKFAWNFQVCMADTGDATGTSCGDPNNYSPKTFKNEMIATPTPSYTDSNTGDIVYEYSPASMIANANICGSITIPGVVKPNVAIPAKIVGQVMSGTTDPGTIAAAIQQAQQQTIQSLIGNGGQFATVGADIAKVSIPQLNTGTIPTNSDYVNLVNQYENTLQQNLAAQIPSSSLTSAQATTISSLGWAAAGAWLNTIARDQGSIVNAYEDGLPKTEPPDFSKLTTNNWAQTVAKQLNDFKTWITYTTPTANSNEPNTGCLDQQVASSNTSESPSAPPSASVAQILGVDNYTDPIKNSTAAAQLRKLAHAMSGGKADGNDIVGLIFGVIDAQAARSGIWQSGLTACNGQSGAFVLGAQLVTANPLQEFSFWGYANLRTAYDLYSDIYKLSVAEIGERIEYQLKNITEGMKGVNDVPRNVQELGLLAQFYGGVASLLSLFATIFFVSGYTIAFVVPLMPFFRFFFSVLTWIVSVLEAIVAVPLIALAHLNPEGDHLHGQSAKGAYYLIFNIFLRPVSTLFGLIAGLIVFYVAIIFLNATFAIAVAGTGAGYHQALGTLVRIAYTITYAATVYVCANNCFKTIGMFPEYALRWVGQQAHHERMGDGGRAVQGVMTQTQGYLGDKTLGVIRLKPPG